MNNVINFLHKHSAPAYTYLHVPQLYHNYFSVTLNVLRTCTCSPYVLWCNMYLYRSIEAKENIYLGINESETLPHHGMFIHLLIVDLDEEWHAICHQ